MRRTYAHPCFPSQRDDGPTQASQAHPYTPSLLPSFPPERTTSSSICSGAWTQQIDRGRERAATADGMLLLRRRAAAALLLVFAAAAAMEEASSLPVVEPMELYFSPAELARIAGYGEEPVSSVSVSGQVACELCLRRGSDLLAFELPGAKVAVLCETECPNDQAANSALATTDEFGNFTIDLPSQLHATANLERACTVKVLQLPADSSCRLRHQPSTTYGLMLASQEDGVRAYTTGVIRLQNNDTPHGKCVSVEERTGRR
ncbi:uncharacterized protein [Setaria viridis]|nr:uncharacterized protein LOC117842481 [Setaria viridis]